MEMERPYWRLLEWSKCKEMRTWAKMMVILKTNGRSRVVLSKYSRQNLLIDKERVCTGEMQEPRLDGTVQ